MPCPVNTILVGDVLSRIAEIPDETVDCVVTSPPYFGLRDYGVAGQVGLEATPQEYVEKMVLVFREVRRVLKKSGVLWLVLGDSYAGSGRGRDGDGTHAAKSGEKQKTNKGSTAGVLRKVDFHDKIVEAGAIGRDWVPPPEGLKPKDLIGIPWRVALALQADGWWLRQDIVWQKRNPMPESVTDRCTKSHEHVFLMTKSAKYHYDADSIREPSGPDKTPGRGSRAFIDRDVSHQKKGELAGAHGTLRHDGNGMRMAEKWNNPKGRNKRSVWSIATKPYRGAHFATFPEKLVEPCIKAGCPKGGIVLDPFMGSGTVGVVAKMLGRNWLGIELSAEYAAMAEARIGSWNDPVVMKRKKGELVQRSLFEGANDAVVQ